MLRSRNHLQASSALRIDFVSKFFFDVQKRRTAILELNQETTLDKSTVNIKQGDLTDLKLSQGTWLLDNVPVNTVTLLRHRCTIYRTFNRAVRKYRIQIMFFFSSICTKFNGCLAVYAAVEPFSCCLAANSAILLSNIGLKWRINP